LPHHIPADLMGHSSTLSTDIYPKIALAVIAIQAIFFVHLASTMPKELEI